MTENLKRVIGATFTASDIKGSTVLNGFVYPTDSEGKVIRDSEQEHIRLLISQEDMQNLYSVLRVALGKAN